MTQSPDTNVILAEYKSVRDEILQLNSQLFTVLGSSLTLNVAVLGWFFARNEPAEFFVLPTVGILVLFLGNSILLTRNRLAHRLALFQKYFIESRLPDIHWGRAYFEYRDRYQATGLARWAEERLADSGTRILFASSLGNLAILGYFGLRPFFQSNSTQIDWSQSINFAVAASLVVAQDCLRRIMVEYRPIELAMRAVAHKSGLIKD